MSRRLRAEIVVIAFLFLSVPLLAAQDNYEVQVYPADTTDPHVTMLEFHTNLTVRGRKTVEDGVLLTNHAVHETFEITHGFTKWFETGFYIFTSIQPGHGWQWVGDHIRPRVRVPEDWGWPVGVSLSTEFGYQRPIFSADTWTLEIRPIVDKKLGRWYFSFNPTFERALHGANVDRGFEFSPNAKFSYDFTKKISGGLEYYGAFGPIASFDPFAQQEQQILPAIDLNVSPKWELNFGAGVGTTRSTDHLLLKLIVGYRFDKFPFPHF